MTQTERRVALITGASRGLGLALARTLAERSWALVVDARGREALEAARRGLALHTTVMPFILRGVSLLGIESVFYPLAARERLWQRLAADLKPRGLNESIAHEVTLEQVPEVLASILKGGVRGRVVVRLQP